MTLHADALALLRGWAPPSHLQVGLRERYVAHLESHPDAMQRSCRPDHLTASTLVMDPVGSRVLLTLHAKARQWFQFGGHCEPGDTTLVAAAQRELDEESGVPGLRLDPVPLQLSEHEVPFCGGDADGLLVHHLDVRFLAVAPAGVRPDVSEESLDVRWWPADALPAAGDEPEPDLVELVALARARLAAYGESSPGGASSWAAADHPSR